MKLITFSLVTCISFPPGSISSSFCSLYSLFPFHMLKRMRQMLQTCRYRIWIYQMINSFLEKSLLYIKGCSCYLLHRILKHTTSINTRFFKSKFIHKCYTNYSPKLLSCQFVQFPVGILNNLVFPYHDSMYLCLRSCFVACLSLAMKYKFEPCL